MQYNRGINPSPRPWFPESEAGDGGSVNDAVVPVPNDTTTSGCE